VVRFFVTNTDAGTAHDYRKAIRARIEALSEAYGLIESERERCVSLRMLLERTLTPHAALPSDRIVLGGSDIFVEPHLALSLHMIFHELATNARKYGALSSASGSVEVRWDIPACSAGRAVAIQWCGRPALSGLMHRRIGVLGADGSILKFIATVTIIPFMSEGWDASAGGFEATTVTSPSS
jgi:hypothetical protein